jgi:dipeptidyl aminopeptidase/acylaminoacyl peptidase
VQLARFGRALVGLMVATGLAGCPTRQAPEAPSIAPPARAAQPPPRPPAGPLEWGWVIAKGNRLVWVSPEAPSRSVPIAAEPPNPRDVGPAISPDHRKIAYPLAEDRLGITDLASGQSVAVDLADLRAWPECRGWFSAFAWQPDSRRVACACGGDLFAAELTGKVSRVTQQRYVRGKACLGWSPTGSHLAYGLVDGWDRDLGLWAMASGGGSPRLLAKPSGGWFSPAFMSWSPDGNTIAFRHAWEGGRLAFVAADGSRLRTRVGPAWGPLLWLPDSSEVVYEWYVYPDVTWRLARCGPAGDPSSLVKGPVDDCDVSSKGVLLVSVGGEGAHRAKVQAMAPPLGEQKVPWEHAGTYGAVEWRPDGDAWAAARWSGRKDVSLYYGEGAAEPRRIATSATDFVGWALCRRSVELPQSEGGHAHGDGAS